MHGTYFCIYSLVISRNITSRILDFVGQARNPREAVIGCIRSFSPNQGRIRKSVHLFLQGYSTTKQASDRLRQ